MIPLDTFDSFRCFQWILDKFRLSLYLADKIVAMNQYISQFVAIIRLFQQI